MPRYLGTMDEYEDVEVGTKIVVVQPPPVGEPGVHAVHAVALALHFLPKGVQSVTLEGGVDLPFTTECWHTLSQCVHVDFPAPILMAGNLSPCVTVALDDDGADATPTLGHTVEVLVQWDPEPLVPSVDFGSFVQVPNMFGEPQIQDGAVTYPANKDVKVVGSSELFARVVQALARACDPPCVLTWREDAVHFGTWPAMLGGPFRHPTLSLLANTVLFLPQAESEDMLNTWWGRMTVTHSHMSPEYTGTTVDDDTLLANTMHEVCDRDNFVGWRARHYLVVEQQMAAWPKVWHNHIWQTLAL